ncbi:insulinase family protein [Streptomyces sp. NPDC002888]|uniref:M16 family metallopeptidase n=1 Tax=Streptomyces sp. NPDC002888 TaxID=3364668 RepID=UPI0036C878D2
MSPQEGIPLVAVGVHYGVGFRSEPEGRSGFAHLFEHLMFQGSAAVEPGEHLRGVQALGGTAGGSTHQDYTDYHQIAPAAALERLLFLEADRMRSPRLTQDALTTQLAVVKEEIRLQVRDRAYGGFPWTTLPAALYRTYPNAHDGYGDFTDLDRATVDDCVTFFDRHYPPGNAVLTVAGAIDPDRTAALVEQYFGDIPARPAATAPDLREPRPTDRAHRAYDDPHAPFPATAVGLRLPDPADDHDRYLACVLLAHLLAGDGPAGLRSRAHEEGLELTSATSRCGFFGPFDARDPDTLVVTARHPASVHDDFADLVVRTLKRIGDGTLPEEELHHAATARAAHWNRRHDHLLTRTRALGTWTLLYDTPDRLHQVPARLRTLDPSLVRSTAAELSRGQVALLAVRSAKEGPAKKGPATEGPATEGPATEGPATEGPAKEGPAKEGPAKEGAAKEGPAKKGPTTEGPARKGAAA